MSCIDLALRNALSHPVSFQETSLCPIIIPCCVHICRGGPQPTAQPNVFLALPWKLCLATNDGQYKFPYYEKPPPGLTIIVSLHWVSTQLLQSPQITGVSLYAFFFNYLFHHQIPSHSPHIT